MCSVTLWKGNWLKVAWIDEKRVTSQNPGLEGLGEAKSKRRRGTRLPRYLPNLFPLYSPSRSYRLGFLLYGFAEIKEVFLTIQFEEEVLLLLLISELTIKPHVSLVDNVPLEAESVDYGSFSKYHLLVAVQALRLQCRHNRGLRSWHQRNSGAR